MSNLHQHFTPTWAAELIVQNYFSDLSSGDVVLEPACGDGRFLMSIPSHVEAYGVEIDQRLAERAMKNSDRMVVVGDITTVEWPKTPTAIIGNPPYNINVIDSIISRAYEEMDYGGRVGLLIPVYVFQTANSVVEYGKKWSINHDLIPRNLFHRLSYPLMFAQFKKDRQRIMSGLFLYSETASVQAMRKKMREIMMGNNSTAMCWRDVVSASIKACGGTATLSQIYECVEGHRPTENRWWKEKVRQIARMHFERVSEATYSLKVA